MAEKKPDTAALDALKADIPAGRLKNLYIFHGEEKYLLESYLCMIRAKLLAEFAEFNHKRYDARDFTVDELLSACDTLPVFAERTLIEVADFDLFKANEENKSKLLALFDDLPEYVCLIFVYDTLAYEPDGRQKKLIAALTSKATVVEFAVQEPTKLVKWIKKHAEDGGKTIDVPTSEYLAYVTGGLMSSMNTEIDKLCAYAQGAAITRADIDTTVTPVIDAEVWKMTDLIISGSFDKAAAVLCDLLSMQEPPILIHYHITLKLRQLLAARACLDNGRSEKELMRLCGIRFEFQARGLMAGARKLSLETCREMVLQSAETAVRMRSFGEPETHLADLMLALAALKRGEGR